MKNKFLNNLPLIILGCLTLGSLIYYNFIDKETEIKNSDTNGKCESFIYYDIDKSQQSLNIDKQIEEKKTTLICFMDKIYTTEIDQIENTIKDRDDVSAIILYDYTTMLDLKADIQNEYTNSKIEFGYSYDYDDLISSFFTEKIYPSYVSVDRNGSIIDKSTNINDNLLLIQSNAVIGKEVGDILPYYELESYNDMPTYTTRSTLDKFTLINFWGTWCGPCVQELPYFEQFKEEYPECEVIAIHSSNPTSDVQEFLNTHSDKNKKNWKDYHVQFVQDKDTNSLYEYLGGTGIYPMTYVIDKYNVIRKVHSGSVTYEDLTLDYNQYK